MRLRGSTEGLLFLTSGHAVVYISAFPYLTLQDLLTPRMQSLRNDWQSRDVCKGT